MKDKHEVMRVILLLVIIVNIYVVYLLTVNRQVFSKEFKRSSICVVAPQKIGTGTQEIADYKMIPVPTVINEQTGAVHVILYEDETGKTRIKGFK